MVWGQPEQIYTTLKKGYDAAAIPITNWEPDNHLIVNFETPSGWRYLDWGPSFALSTLRYPFVWRKGY